MISICTVEVAQADCSLDLPSRPKPISTSLVRAQAPCGGSFSFPATTSQTSAGVPSCAPPLPISQADFSACVPHNCDIGRSTYRFGPKGACRVQIRPGRYSPCPTSSEVPDCFSLTAVLRCSDVRKADDTPIDSSTGPFSWRLAGAMRVTTNEGAAAMTLMDLPYEARFGATDVNNGSISGRRELIATEPLNFAFSSCTQVQIQNIWLLDPYGNMFAAMGSSTR